MLPVIVVGSVLVGLVALLMGGGSSSSGGGGGGGGGTPTKRTRIVAPGELPGAFATKYGGAFAKWKELPSVNPGMVIVQKRYCASPSGTGTFDVSHKCSDDATEDRLIDWGLDPWADGQEVTIPDSWPG